MSTDHSDGPSIMSIKLWEHPSPETTPMWTFMQTVNSRHDQRLNTYEELYEWSVNNIGAFWGDIWDVTGIRASESFHEVLDQTAPMFPKPAFYRGAKLNFAENLLFPSAAVDPSDVAVLTATETTRGNATWAEVREHVRQCQGGLIAVGLKEGDRVAGYVANHLEALIAMLAATSLGAIWTAVGPDTGAHSVLERLRQIEPTLLFADNASYYNGRSHPMVGKINQVVDALSSLRTIVIFPTVTSIHVDESAFSFSHAKVYDYSALIELDPSNRELSFAQLDPDHPVYILYSSGTTGAPKCIVHGAIGTLIQHKKEHMLHCSIGRGSCLFYYTTCNWMMWHWLVSGLASGATIVLYDGSPFRFRQRISSSASEECQNATSQPDDLAMPRLIEELGVTHFGTSAKYLTLLEQKHLSPISEFSLKSLEAIYSTGSPLPPSTFTYVYSAFPPTINLGSITGGTDIISLFGAPCPLTPVYAGEIQVRGLGMAVQARDPVSGKDVTSAGEPGDLICARPFPCQPVRFWGPDGEAKYRSSYFEAAFESGGIQGNGSADAGLRPVWHHGDFVRIVPQTGGLVMLGRSDGVLKPAGVRFGSAEIYNVLQSRFSERVADALCLGRRREGETDETVVLFLKMAAGARFDTEMAESVRKEIRDALSARHVPGVVDECPEIPVTTNGKKVENAVKQILSGLNIKTSASVANAECLDWYRQWAESHS